MLIQPEANPHWDEHEEVHFFEDAPSGLRAYIAIHSIGPLGISGGGTRMKAYPRDEDALTDALRLSRAMTHKMLLTGASSGGAKCVIIGDPAELKSERLLEALGRAINTLDGRFVAGADVGTTNDDLRSLARFTPYVERTPPTHDVGSEMTARGVLASMLAAAEQKLGSRDLAGVRVAVQGLGKVGASLSRLLHERGAELVLADVDTERAEALAKDLGAGTVPAADVLGEEADIFSPCALGDVIDDDTLERLRCRVVVGAANNPLARSALAETLHGRGILFVPDFVANIGGVLAGAYPSECTTEARRERLAERVVGSVAREVLERASARDITPLEAATQITAERARAAKQKSAGLPQRATRALMGRLWKQRWFARTVMSARTALSNRAVAASG